MPSLQSRIVQALLPLTGAKWACQSERNLRRGLKLIRRFGPAMPPRRLRRKFSVTEKTIEGMRVFTVSPRDAYLHGGGYVVDIMAPHWHLIARLVAKTSCCVTVPLYPLAPENDCADVMARMVALHQVIAANSNDPIFMGDSAGGGMALALAQELRDKGLNMPQALVLISPWLDVGVIDPDQPELARHDRMLDIPGARAAGRWYAGSLDITDPRVSPLYGALDGLPPILVFTGTHDVLNADARRLRDKAAAHSFPLEYREYAGMFHAWPLLRLPETDRALGQIADFISVIARRAG